MDIIQKFGNAVSSMSLEDPGKARRLLLTGYRLQEKRLLFFSDKKLPKSGQYVARIVMKNIIQHFQSLKIQRWSASLFRESF